MSLLLSRRALLAAAPIATLSLPASAAERPKGAFTHGVASGDPTAEAVILWTRFVPASGKAATIGWEVSEDESFAKIVARGAAEASPSNDWCVKADARGLKPGARYFYRFVAADVSPVGLTRTAPKGAADSVTFALFACSNLPFGHFHAYGHAAAREDIDLCIHVGDYIYEYPRGDYPVAADVVPGRLIEPAHEIIALADYRARYASYRADPHLQELHRVKPFMTVWDDHEIANDAWTGGAQNHDPAKEGDWVARRAAAAKAYDEWMPIRAGDSLLKLYRRYDWGDLASFILLDTRIIGRDEPLDWEKALKPAMGGGMMAVAAAAQKLARGPMADPKRSLLGAEQEAWLSAQLKASKAQGAPWQVLAQQVVMGETRAPANTGELAGEVPADLRPLLELAVGLSAMGLPWNLDAWVGYPAARQRFLADCAANANNALVLAGDSHNAWFHQFEQNGRRAAIEMATGSVSSPGLEKYLPAAGAGQREASFRATNADLAFCDLTHRGYAAARLTREAAQSEWVALSSVKSAEAPKATVTRLSAAATKKEGPGAWSVG